MARIYLLILPTALLASSCTILSRRGPAADQSPAATPKIAAVTATPSPAPASTPEGAAGMSATLACQTVDPGEYDIYKKQTFAIDFEPFRDSCFVTSHNPE